LLNWLTRGHRNRAAQNLQEKKFKLTHYRLASLVDGKPIACAVHGRDRYRRLLVTCDVAGQDIGAALVRAGLALAYRKYSSRYFADEDAAKAAKAGACAGSFEAPAKFRDRRYK
jgi:endonuclease YncB( thermonuclease family)